MTFLYYLVLGIFLLCSLFLCGIILMQESKSSGLGASLGGADVGNSFFGTSTPDILYRITAYTAVIFMVGCISLSLYTGFLGNSKVQESIELIQEDL